MNSRVESKDARREAEFRVKAADLLGSDVLSLSGLRIKSPLPPGISALKNLRSLDLSRNRLTEFPLELCELPLLEQLFLQNNRLSTLPDEIIGLQRLQRLYVYSNDISYVSRQMGSLGALTEIKLHNNRIRAIPSELGQLHTRALSKPQSTRWPTCGDR